MLGGGESSSRNLNSYNHGPYYRVSSWHEAMILSALLCSFKGCNMTCPIRIGFRAL